MNNIVEGTKLIVVSFSETGIFRPNLDGITGAIERELTGSEYPITSAVLKKLGTRVDVAEVIGMGGEDETSYVIMIRVPKESL